VERKNLIVLVRLSYTVLCNLWYAHNKPREKPYTSMQATTATTTHAIIEQQLKKHSKKLYNKKTQWDK
jgi:hypothetical protein